MFSNHLIIFNYVYESSKKSFFIVRINTKANKILYEYFKNNLIIILPDSTIHFKFKGLRIAKSSINKY